MRSIRERLAALVPRPFGFVHLAWAILILAGCVALVLMGGGHPPPMIFVPPLLAAGLLGHLLLLFVAWLLAKGRSRIAAAQGAARRWPLALVLIAIALGVLAICAIVITIGEFSNVWSKPLVWLMYAAIALLHTSAFVCLLMRIGAARFLVAAVPFGWGLALILQLGEARPGELPIAAALIGGLLGIAVYVLRSRRIRSVLG
ncbi:MAG: hypothetical protein ACRES3_05175 [Steroidobacteraceae bacterium]